MFPRVSHCVHSGTLGFGVRVVWLQVHLCVQEQLLGPPDLLINDYNKCPLFFFSLAPVLVYRDLYVICKRHNFHMQGGFSNKLGKHS